MKVERKQKDIYAYRFDGDFTKFRKWVVSNCNTPSVDEYCFYDEEEGLEIITYEDEISNYNGMVDSTTVFKGDYILYDTHLGWDVMEPRDFDTMYNIIEG